MKGLSKDRKKILKKCLTNYQLYLMILPAFIFIILFEYLPMYGVQIAFRDFNFKEGIVNSAWVGLENFKRLFNSYWFPIIFKNTITLSGLRLLVGFPMPIIFALMVNEIGHGKVKKWIQTVSYAPHFISTVVMCGMIILLLTPETGLFNLIIQAFGGESISFMQNPKLFKWIHVLSGVWQGTGWSAIIYFAALSGVDQGLLEAAQIDGAGVVRTFWSVMLPNARGVIVTVALFAFVWQWNDVYYTGMYEISGETFPMLTRKLITMSERVAGLILQPQYVDFVNQVGEGIAKNSLFTETLLNCAALMMMSPLLIGYLFVQRLFIEGVERSGIVG